MATSIHAKVNTKVALAFDGALADAVSALTISYVDPGISADDYDTDTRSVVPGTAETEVTRGVMSDASQKDLESYGDSNIQFKFTLKKLLILDDELVITIDTKKYSYNVLLGGVNYFVVGYRVDAAGATHNFIMEPIQETEVS